MSKVEIENLERDVVEARARLSADLARLASPQVFSGFKADVSRDFDRLKQQAIDTTKEAARERAQDIVEMVTDRIVANPAAAAAIGAGLAWRLFRHPPISTALIGVGLYELLRGNGNGSATDHRTRRYRVRTPGKDGGGIDWRSKAEVLADNARGQLADAADFVSGHVSEAAGVVGHKVGDAAAVASAAISDTAAAAQGAIGGATQAAAARVGEMATDATVRARRSLSNGGEAAAEWTKSGRRKVSRFIQDPDPRDTVLLGAAAVAIVAAIGLAAQRRAD